MYAFRGAYTLDPDGWNQSATLCVMQERAKRNARVKDFIPRYVAAEQQTDEQMEKLMRAFAKKRKKKKE